MNDIVYFLIRMFTWGLYGYLLCGFVFALWFVARGAVLLDEGMRDIPWKTKWIFIPGGILLWVYLWIKIKNQQKHVSDPADQNK